MALLSSEKGPCPTQAHHLNASCADTDGQTPQQQMVLAQAPGRVTKLRKAMLRPTMDTRLLYG